MKKSFYQMRIVCKNSTLSFLWLIVIVSMISPLQFWGCSSIKSLDQKTVYLTLFSEFDSERLQGFRDGLNLIDSLRDTTTIIIEYSASFDESKEGIEEKYRKQFQKVVTIDLRKPLDFGEEHCFEPKSIINLKPRSFPCDSIKLEKLLYAVKALFPSKIRLGVVWVRDSVESNSRKKKFQEIVFRNGLELILVESGGEKEFKGAFKQLLREKPQIYFAGESLELQANFETYAELLTRERIPIITKNISFLSRGAFAGFGLLPYQEGRFSAELLKSASLQGGKALSSPPHNQFYFQPSLLAEFRVKIPAAFIAYEPLQRKK
ncbi:MAG: hypothetical protein SFU91_11810 [Chloroherpetonaceae bacterium]|nr:hypothetical protein [Chloroherpetonaceae bacterium]